MTADPAARVAVESVGAMTSIGTGARQMVASVRAGLSRFAQGWWAATGPAVVVALAPEDAIESSCRIAEPRMESIWQGRLAALAAIAIRDAMQHRDPDDRPLVLMLGLPDPRRTPEPIDTAALWAALAATSGRTIDTRRSQVFPTGRAACFDALAAGRTMLSHDPEAVVLCGAVDSYADDERIEREREELRTCSDDRPGDGRVLGEGAGMVLLSTAPTPTVELVAHALADDPGHRYGVAPARGEGLADAIEQLRSQAEPTEAMGSVWAGLTGEAHDAKLWGVATIRHRDLMPPGTRIEHPADRLGDAGAGLGALLLVSAHHRLSTGHPRGPALSWAASDHGRCGCALLRATPCAGATP